MFIHEITIYNKKNDSYVRTYLENVNLTLNKGINTIKQGIEDANSGILIIPDFVLSENREYKSPKTFLKTENCWTLKEQDIIVKGKIDYQITKDNTLAKLRKEYDDVYTIVAVDDNRKGGLPHFEVGLK